MPAAVGAIGHVSLARDRPGLQSNSVDADAGGKGDAAYAAWKRLSDLVVTP